MTDDDYRPQRRGRGKHVVTITAIAASQLLQLHNNSNTYGHATAPTMAVIQSFVSGQLPPAPRPMGAPTDVLSISEIKSSRRGRMGFLALTQ